MVLDSHDNHHSSPQFSLTERGRISVHVFDGKTGTFAARRRAIGRPSARRSTPARLRQPFHDSRFRTPWRRSPIGPRQDGRSARRRRRMGHGNSGGAPRPVDSAAGQALIGDTACVKWEQKLNGACLRGVQVHTKVATAEGVGGAAHPTRSVMMPTVIDGLPGVLQHTVAEEDIQGMLPFSFQEKQGALIDLGTNKLHLPASRSSCPHAPRQEGTARSM